MRRAAVAHDAPFRTKCLPSKKSAEYSGYVSCGAKPETDANGVSVHSQPLPQSSWMPQGLIPSGCEPTGLGDQWMKLKLPWRGAGASVPQAYGSIDPSGRQNAER